MNLERFKKSDRKQRQKAWDAFHSVMTSLMDHMQYLIEIPDDEVSVDELHQLTTRIDKLDKFIAKMGEVRMLRLKKK